MLTELSISALIFLYLAAMSCIHTSDGARGFVLQNKIRKELLAKLMESHETDIQLDKQLGDSGMVTITVLHLLVKLWNQTILIQVILSDWMQCLKENIHVIKKIIVVTRIILKACAC